MNHQIVMAFSQHPWKLVFPGVAILTSLTCMIWGVRKFIKAAGEDRGLAAFGWLLLVPVLGVLGLFLFPLIALGLVIVIAMWVCGAFISSGVPGDAVRRAQVRHDVDMGASRAVQRAQQDAYWENRRNGL
jgi:hypothetical protein